MRQIPVSDEVSHHCAKVSVPYTVQGGSIEPVSSQTPGEASNTVLGGAQLTALQLLPLARLIAREMVHDSGDQCYDTNTQ